MPQTCKVCSGPHRTAIDRALVRRTPYRVIVEEFGVSKTGLSRHLENCVAPRVHKLRERADDRAALDVVGALQRLLTRVEGQLSEAERGDAWRPVVAFAGELRKNLELAGKLVGDIEPPTVNVYIDARVEAVILDALAPHPDARLAVAAALAELEPELEGSE